MYGYGYGYHKAKGGGGLPFTPPLDVYTGAAAAYSISRILRSDYTGYAFTVRRTSDSATLDVGFLSNGYVDLPSLLSFAGVNTCVITTIYDQVGSNNWTQATPSAQAQIVNAGSVNYLSGTSLMPTLRADGSDDTYDLGTELTLSQYLITTVSDFSTVAKILYGGKTGPSFMGQRINTAQTEFQFRGESNIAIDGNEVITLNTPYVHSMQCDSTSNSFKSFVNGVEDTLTRTTNETFKLGKLFTGFNNSTAFEWHGGLSEMLVWSSANAANRAGIEANLINQYL